MDCLLSFKERMNALMAESRAKSTANGQSTKTVKDSKLWSLLCLAREVASETDGLQSYTSLVEESRRLESELSSKSAAVMQLQQGLAEQKADAANRISALTKTFGEQYKIFDQKNAVFETCRQEMEKLKTELQTHKERDMSQQRQLTTMESKAKSTKGINDQLNKKIEILQKECYAYQSRLQAAEAERDGLNMKLKQAQEDLGGGAFHDIDEARKLNLTKQFQRMADRSYSLAKEFLSDIEVPTTASISISNLRSVVPEIPLTNGSSQEAVLMRRAAAQAMLCQALIDNIFRPFYFPDASDQDGFHKAAEKMVGFFEGERDQELIYRYQITKLLDDEKMENAAEAAAKASSTVYSLLNRLVPGARVEEFRQNLDDFIREVAEVWARHAQRASDIVVATLPMAGHEQPESYEEEYGVRSSIVRPRDVNRKIAAALFPRITVNGKILHRGMVLWSDSPAIILARDQIPSPTTGSRVGTGWKNGRRNSSVGKPVMMSSRIEDR